MKKMVLNAINIATKDYQVYKHTDGLWVINPMTKDWVVNISESGYLWYNYDFFKDLFKYFSLIVPNDKKYIREWVEYKLQVKVGRFCEANYLPHEYDWRKDFSTQCVLDKGEPVVFI